MLSLGTDGAMPPRQPRHWGGNLGGKWNRKTVVGLTIQTCDHLRPEDYAPRLDVTPVEEPVKRRHELEPLDLPPRPGARQRLWGNGMAATDYKRPVYENAASLKMEAQLAARIEQKLGFKAIKLPFKYRVDFGLYRGPRREFTGVAELHDLDAIAEVKGRNYPLARLDEWGGYMLSLDKWLGAETICRTADVPFYIVISFQGDVRMTEVRYPFPVLPSRISGRTDRGDWQDVEPVVLFRGDMFRPL